MDKVEAAGQRLDSGPGRADSKIHCFLQVLMQRGLPPRAESIA